jgi:hypothetical protein
MYISHTLPMYSHSYICSTGKGSKGQVAGHRPQATGHRPQQRRGNGEDLQAVVYIKTEALCPPPFQFSSFCNMLLVAVRYFSQSVSVPDG